MKPGSNMREHIRKTPLNGKVHNNRMEWMNSELRQREEAMRTLEKTRYIDLDCEQIFHNYVRPHDTLKGKTPSEVAGIKISGNDKWLILIQNASGKSNAKA